MDSALDGILGLQLLVAWAGEGGCDPPRLAWWMTDAVDEMGGGDFFKRLAPRTHRWAALEAARRAAILVEEKKRRLMPDADAVRTLFFWGFEFDEKLNGRLRDLKLQGDGAEQNPYDLPLPPGNDMAIGFNAEVLKGCFTALGDVRFQTLPTGRQIKEGFPDAPLHAAQRLCAALVPFSTPYPMPFYRLREVPQ